MLPSHFFQKCQNRIFFALFWDWEGPVNSLFSRTASANSAKDWAGSLFCSWKSSWKPPGWSLVLIKQESCGVSCLSHLFLQAHKIEFLVLWCSNQYDTYTPKHMNCRAFCENKVYCRVVIIMDTIVFYNLK